MWKKVYIGNGHGAYEEALFDTGASITLVDHNVAQKLGLKYVGTSIELKGVSGQPFHALGFEAKIYVPEARCWRKQVVYVPEIPVQVDGKVIVGRDLMRATRMRLQYGNGDTVSCGQETDDVTDNPPPGSRTVAGAVGGALLGWAVAGPVGAFLGLIFGGALGSSAET